MQGSSDNSFIPKRGAAKRKQVGGSRQIYIFSYISYILMFATLLAAGGVYLYGQYINSQLDAEIATLNSEIGSFSQADMERVTQFNLRLVQAQDRLDNSVSVASVFQALQAATIDTVQIESLEMKREGDDMFVLNAIVQTDTFDSTIFQRGVYLRNGTIQDVLISEVQNVIATESNQVGEVTDTKDVVSFQALLEIPLSDVPAVPETYQNNQPAVDAFGGISPEQSEQPVIGQPVGENLDETEEFDEANDDTI